MNQVVITSGLLLKVMLLVLVIVAFHKWLRYRKEKNWALFESQIFSLLTVYYVCIIFSFTLLPISYPSLVPSSFELNLNVLELFNSFSNRYALISNAENVLLFMPLTILAYCSNFKKFKQLKWCALLAFAVSLIVEALQGVEAVAHVLEDSMPICDINDLICNTLGGILGYYVIYFYKKEHTDENVQRD